MDNLVEKIAARVEARLAERTRSLGATALPTPTAPASDCSTCKNADVCGGPQTLGAVTAGAKRLGIRSTAPLPAAPCAHVAPLIDHTLLKPEASRSDIQTACDEARLYNFASVCVSSSNVRLASSCLQGAATKAIAVVGFPTGAETPHAKAFEAKEAVRNGAEEIDMVLNIGALKSKDYVLVLDDIRAVVNAARNAPVKVILETSKLNDEEKIVACGLAKAAGAAFVKTSTGFGGGGATPEDVSLMRRVVGDDIGVKASGGIRSYEDAERVIDAGATRIGASASIAIVKCEKKAGGSGY